MYPTDELNQLAVHKAVLCRTITRNRRGFFAAGDVVVQPLRWLDLWLKKVRRFAPFVPPTLVLLGCLIPRARAQSLSWPQRMLRHGRVIRLVVRGLTFLAVARKATTPR